IVVLNTVERATQVYDALVKAASGRAGPAPRVVLLHSRFRPPERAEHLVTVLAEPPREGTIVVATQVLEAGGGVSSRLPVAGGARGGGGGGVGGAARGRWYPRRRRAGRRAGVGRAAAGPHRGRPVPREGPGRQRRGAGRAGRHGGHRHRPATAGCRRGTADVS